MQGYRLFLTHLNFAKGFRGGERQTLLLIEELSRRGFKQKIITRKNSELAQRLEGVENLKIIKIAKPYVFNILKFKDSFIIHAHETKAAQVAYFINLIYSIPYIVTRRVDFEIKNNFFNKSIYLNSYKTVVLSSAIKRSVHKLDEKIDIEIIPSCYTDFNYNKMNIKTIKERFDGKFLIGNIGALEYAKGQDLLIKVAKEIEKKYPKIHFIFLGKGKDEEKFRSLASDLNNITFEGFVNNVGDYCSCLDLFVFPSLNEGLGSILLDVMQAKVPIIASNVGGIPDLISNNDNGLLVESKNSDQIYNAIEKLYLNKELRERLAFNGFEGIDNYSYESMCDKYVDLYNEII